MWCVSLRGDRNAALVVTALVLVAAGCASGDATTPTTDGAVVTTTLRTTLPPTSRPGATSPPGASSPPATPSAATPRLTPDPVRTVLDVDGLERTYVLYVPESLPNDRLVALVVDLHGLGSDAAGHEATSHFAAKAASEGFVVAQPEARGDVPTWNPQPGAEGAMLDVAFLRALVADVGTKVELDPGRIYLSGFSNGGGMAHRFACDAADVVAAIGTVSGQYAANDSCQPSQPVAIISFHGTADLVVGYGGFGDALPPIPSWAEGWAARNACAPVPERQRIAEDVLWDRWTDCSGNVQVVLHTIEGGAHAWPGSDRPGFFAPTQSIDATDLMWEFFEAHVRG